MRMGEVNLLSAVSLPIPTRMYTHVYIRVVQTGFTVYRMEDCTNTCTTYHTMKYDGCIYPMYKQIVTLKILYNIYIVLIRVTVLYILSYICVYILSMYLLCILCKGVDCCVSY